MSNLTSINIPNRVRKICSSAFSNDNKLTTITIPDSVREIEYSAFYKCTGLKTIKIPRRVEKIDEYKKLGFEYIFKCNSFKKSNNSF